MLWKSPKSTRLETFPLQPRFGIQLRAHGARPVVLPSCYCQYQAAPSTFQFKLFAVCQTNIQKCQEITCQHNNSKHDQSMIKIKSGLLRVDPGSLHPTGQPQFWGRDQICNWKKLSKHKKTSRKTHSYETKQSVFETTTTTATSTTSTAFFRQASLHKLGQWL